MFDPVAYKESLKKKMNERYTIKEVDPASVSQGDLGLDSGNQQPPTQTTPTTPSTTPEGKPKAKDPEISMEVLKGTVKWALGEKESWKII